MHDQTFAFNRTKLFLIRTFFSTSFCFRSSASTDVALRHWALPTFVICGRADALPNVSISISQQSSEPEEEGLDESKAAPGEEGFDVGERGVEQVDDDG